MLALLAGDNTGKGGICISGETPPRHCAQPYTPLPWEGITSNDDFPSICGDKTGNGEISSSSAHLHIRTSAHPHITAAVVAA
jgi:hypothetical protein